MLKESASLWKNILEARYEDVQKAVIMGVEFKSKKKESVWWKDLMVASLPKTNDFDYFAKNLCFGLGARNNILFWFGGTTLNRLYPLLFSLSSKLMDCVNEMGVRPG